MVPSSPQQPAPGWYPDPGRPTTDRYWDGVKWTAQTRLGSSSSSPPSWQYTGPQPRSNDLVIAGWITAFVFPIAGLIIGVGLLTRDEQGHGIPITVVSAVMFVLYVLALAAG